MDSFPIIGEMGYPILINPSRVFTLAQLEPNIAEYRNAWKKAGHPGEPKVGLRTPFYVAATEERAYSEPKESAMGSIRRLGERVTGLADFRGTTGDWGTEGQRILDMEYEDWLRDKVVFGTPDAAVEKVNALKEKLGLSQIMFEINFGNLIPIELQRKSLKLITEEVLPPLPVGPTGARPLGCAPVGRPLHAHCSESAVDRPRTTSIIFFRRESLPTCAP